MNNKKAVELIERIAKDRDETAFSEIFDYIAPKINAYYIKHNLSSQLAEELTQEVLSTIWIKAELFNSEKSKFTTPSSDVVFCSLIIEVFTPVGSS